MRILAGLVLFSLLLVFGLPLAVGDDKRSFEAAEEVYEDLVRCKACTIDGGTLVRVLPWMPEVKEGSVKIWVGDARMRRLTQLLMICYDGKGRATGYLWAKEARFGADSKNRQVLLRMTDANYVAADEATRWSCKDKVFPISLPPAKGRAKSFD